MIWYALRTAPQREFKAADAIMRMGGKTITPYEIQYKRTQGKGGKPIVKETKTPLITGYVFAGFDYAPWRKIKEDDKIIGIVTIDGVPARLTSSDLSCLNTMHKNAFRLSRHNKSFQPGDKIRIMEGPFLGQDSILRKIMSDKVVVDVMAFGSAVKATVPVKSIERV